MDEVDRFLPEEVIRCSVKL